MEFIKIQRENGDIIRWVKAMEYPSQISTISF